MYFSNGCKPDLIFKSQEELFCYSKTNKCYVTALRVKGKVLVYQKKVSGSLNDYWSLHPPPII